MVRRDPRSFLVYNSLRMYREKDLDLQVSGNLKVKLVSGNLKVFEQHLWLRRRETGSMVSYLPWYVMFIYYYDTNITRPKRTENVNLQRLY
jgi:hypothetical protein